jgi:hypothetical protein
MFQVYVFIGIFLKGFNRFTGFLRIDFNSFLVDGLSGLSAGEALFCRKI